MKSPGRLKRQTDVENLMQLLNSLQGNTPPDGNVMKSLHKRDQNGKRKLKR